MLAGEGAETRGERRRIREQEQGAGTRKVARHEEGRRETWRGAEARHGQGDATMASGREEEWSW
jgi:hypothetical protein